MRPHALLTASGSKRWLSCTPSARLEATFAEKETTAAAQGTAAHALAEYKVKRALRYFCKRLFGLLGMVYSISPCCIAGNRKRM